MKEKRAGGNQQVSVTPLRVAMTSVTKLTLSFQLKGRETEGAARDRKWTRKGEYSTWRESEQKKQQKIIFCSEIGKMKKNIYIDNLYYLAGKRAAT